MVVRWVAASLLDMEQHFKRIMGYQQLWILDAKLKDLAGDVTVPGSVVSVEENRPLCRFLSKKARRPKNGSLCNSIGRYKART
jgi:hypothetical protein